MFGESLGVEAGKLEELWGEVMGRFYRGVKRLVLQTLQESQYPLERLGYAVSQMDPTHMEETVKTIEKGI